MTEYEKGVSVVFTLVNDAGACQHYYFKGGRSAGQEDGHIHLRGSVPEAFKTYIKSFA